MNNKKIKILPRSIKILYILLVLGDALTTFLAAPTLENEANPLVKILGFGWVELLLFDFTSVCIVLFFIIRLNDSLVDFFVYRRSKISIKILVGIIFHIIFAIRCIGTIDAIPCNIFVYIYLYGPKYDWLSETSYIIKWINLPSSTTIYILFNFAYSFIGMFLLWLRICYLRYKLLKHPD